MELQRRSISQIGLRWSIKRKSQFFVEVENFLHSRSSLDMGSSVRLRQTSRQKTDSNTMIDKVQILPPDYLQELSKEVMSCFKGHHV